MHETPRDVLSGTMRCIEIREPGAPEVLVPGERPIPGILKHEVIIKVAHAGVNRPDVLQRTGNYPVPKGASDLPGLEVAGEIAAVGADVTRWKVGDKVCALTPGGGYAEYCVTPAAHCLPLPSGFDLKRAAALPETYFTVWTNVFMRGRLKAGERILIHGGTSGIGTTAIQLAKAFGAEVFTTAGSAEKCRACLDLGATHAMNYREANWAEEVAKSGGADVILDMVGGPYIQANVESLRPEGRLVQIAFLGGSKVSEFNFLKMMLNRLTLTGSTLRPQSNEAKAEIARGLEEKVWPLLNAGTVGPVMFADFPLEKASGAHTLMETSTHIGKIVLNV
ncbi:MAG: NAD(P)H-quinone oxidoreductase [Alphaproteobacteria bacterium]|nr:NAD(P)H-quinone oxidoreductase [Alphaproteobacteria bacterium]